MKSLISFILFSFFAFQLNAQGNTSKISKPDPSKKTMIVEASCGQCQFKLNSGGCDLAVRIDGKAYFVDGTKIDDHGDSHGSDGFCEVIKKAEVQGEVINNRFVATYFKVLAQKPKDKEKM